MQTIISAVGEFLAGEGRFILVIGSVIGVFYAWKKVTSNEDFLRWWVRINPKSGRAHFALAKHLASDNPQEAEAEFRQAIELEPTRRDSYYALAQLLLEQPGRLQDARLSITHTLELFPENAAAHVYEGMLLELEHSYAASEEAYRKAIEIAPGLSWPYYCLGGLLSREPDKYPDAERAYSKAIENNPQVWGNYYNLGALLARMGRTSEAMDCFLACIERNPKLAGAYISLGSLLMATNRSAEAKGIVRRAIAAQPKSALDEYNLGHLLGQLRLFTEAENAYRRAINKDNNFADAYNRLGTLLIEQFSRDAEAERLYRQALTIKPNDHDANCNLARLLRESQRAKEAIPFLRQALTAAPNDIESCLAIASIEKSLGEREAFLEDASKARTLIPADDFYDLACLESICDNKQLALQHLRNAVGQSDFDSVWAWKDPDLQDVRDDPRFLEIVGPPPAPDLPRANLQAARL